MRKGETNPNNLIHDTKAAKEVCFICKNQERLISLALALNRYQGKERNSGLSCFIEILADAPSVARARHNILK